MALLIKEFDTWREGYGGAVVTVKKASDDTNASIYTDTALSVAASNPQTLSDDGNGNGKFALPLYVGVDYYLDIDSTDQTGVVNVPLTTLVAADASDAQVTTTGGSQANNLDDILDRVIHAEDYGAVSAAQSAATNTTTITAAIGEAANRSGGYVYLPAGNLNITQLTLSAGVILVGEGRGVTTLTSTTGDNVITLSGDGAGLKDLTLDGSTKAAGSVGVYSKANNRLFMHDVLIKRFVTGMHFKGGREFRWHDLSIDNCTTGAKLHGDNDAGGGADGDSFQNNRWFGGKVTTCTTTGVDLSYVDLDCKDVEFYEVGFESNTGTAINNNGAEDINFTGCWMTGNTTDIAIDDDADNDVAGFGWKGGFINGGAVTLDGTCDRVIFQGVSLEDVDFTLTAIENNILCINCTEDALVTIAGTAAVKFTRRHDVQDGFTYGVTTDGTATKAWAYRFDPGQRFYATAKVIGNQRNGDNSGEYYFARSGKRPPSTLPYDTQTANFTVGDVLTGGTSGATARIVADSDSGSTGTLSLKDIVGTFQNNETITDDSGGSALVNGTITDVNVSLLGTTTNFSSAREDVAGWAADFAANGAELEVQVTGASSTTIDWIAQVNIVVID